MRSRVAIVLGFAALLGAAAPSRVLAATFTVTKTADTNDGACDADCSLREAIVAANASAGADTIVLGSGLTYTLTRGPADAPTALTAGSGDLDITDSVTIEGNGSTVDAGALDRVFHIDGNIDVTINNLKITGGAAPGFLSLGGGVYVHNARLVMNSCTITGNTTAADPGSSDDGGGIAVVGSYAATTGVATIAKLTLAGSTVSSNHGSNGGGILCAICALNVSNSTIASNTASGDGGGIDMVGNASSLTVTGSNLVSNSAGRGGAIAIPWGTSTSNVNLNRIVLNTATTATGLFDYNGTVNLDNNWWGCNYGPGAIGGGCSLTPNNIIGLPAVASYLVLNVTAAPPSVQFGGSSTITADLTKNNLSNDTSAGGAIRDGTPATFSGTNGTFATTTALTTGGKASDLFTSNTAGTAALSVTFDGQTIGRSLTVYPPWTDDPLVVGVTPIKAVHINEIRSRIDALRTTWHLGAYPYTTPTMVAGTTLIHAQDILDLRASLAQVYTAAAVTPPVYTDSGLSAGTPVLAIDISELRDAVVNME